MRLCACGCGEATPLAKRTDSAKGHRKGEPVKWVPGHHRRFYARGRRNSAWKGGTKMNNGYRMVRCPGHPRAQPKDSYVFEHILVAEKSLGRHLPEGAVVHHINEVKTDNRPENLVICPDSNYHALLHARMNALRECGRPHWRKCVRCKQYDGPENLRSAGPRSVAHGECANAYLRDWRKENREAQREYWRRYRAQRKTVDLEAAEPAEVGR